jgi:peptidoglycan-associated lipoprotein
MKMKASLAVLAIVAALSGCATTADQPDTDGGAPVTSIAPGTTSTATATGITGGTTSGQPLGAETTSASRGDLRPDLKRSVYYEFDRYDVKPEYRALVQSHARWLVANPKARLTIEGNTDERGSREYNVALGQRRAESVTAMLVLMGAKPDQIEAVSFGKEKPRSTGHDEAAFAENRRSDFAGR